MQDTIALICDCDQTLASDSTNLLLEKNDIEKDPFWDEVGKLVENGWDPPQAWMNKILNLMNNGDIEQNSIQKLRELGNEIKLYEGVSNLSSELRDEVNKNEDFVKAGIRLELFIISQGIEDLIKGCDAFSDFTVYASQFSETDGKISDIKSIVTFTEKTKFLFAIHKGITDTELRKSPYDVNKTIEADDRPVPFDHMIYLGDSVNDIPCFSMLAKQKGHTMSINPTDDYRKGFQLTTGNRTRYGPYSSNYNKGSDLRIALSSAINEIGWKIIWKQKIKN